MAILVRIGDWERIKNLKCKCNYKFEFGKSKLCFKMYTKYRPVTPPVHWPDWICTQGLHAGAAQRPSRVRPQRIGTLCS